MKGWWARRCSNYLPGRVRSASNRSSRGAASAVCVEKSSRHAEFLRKNIEAAGFAPKSYPGPATQDVLAALGQLIEATAKFDLIFADPPYGEKNVGRRSESWAQRLLDQTDLPELLSPGGLFVLGHSKRDTLSLPGWWKDKKVLRHGDSTMRFLLR